MCDQDQHSVPGNVGVDYEFVGGGMHNWSGHTIPLTVGDKDARAVESLAWVELHLAKWLPH